MDAMRPKIYGIDLDGVCFDFANAFRLWLNDALHIHMEREEITSYYWYESTDDVSKEEFFREFDKFGDEGHGYRNLDLLPGALEGVKKLHEAGHKIYYITNRPLYALQDTIDCLEEHGFPQRENLHFAQGDKTPLVHDFNVDVFIDDSPRTVSQLTANTRASIYCRDYPFNRHLDDSFFTRVSGWDEFLESEGFACSAIN
jgi:uncharacterized HAD superfamily protein